MADFLDELGPLALGSRLKRLSDRLVKDAVQVYQHFGQDFEPRWFPLIKLLEARGQVGVVEAAEALGVSQPAISQFLKSLVKEGLVKVSTSPDDSRKKLMELSEFGWAKVAEMRPMWQAVSAAAVTLCDEVHPQFFANIKALEKQLQVASLLQRTQAAEHARNNADVRFLEFTPELAEHFFRINKEWIEEDFDLEASDLKILQDPDRYLIQPGGKIWFAQLADGRIVGTCALKKVATGVFELTKMGVTKATRGHKVGEKLLQKVLAEAQRHAVQQLFLLTNARCRAAIHLYEKNGFKHCPEILEKYGGTYERCDVAMLYTPVGT